MVSSEPGVESVVESVLGRSPNMSLLREVGLTAWSHEQEWLDPELRWAKGIGRSGALDDNHRLQTVVQAGWETLAALPDVGPPPLGVALVAILEQALVDVDGHRFGGAGSTRWWGHVSHYLAHACRHVAAPAQNQTRTELRRTRASLAADVFRSVTLAFTCAQIIEIARGTSDSPPSVFARIEWNNSMLLWLEKQSGFGAGAEAIRAAMPLVDFGDAVLGSPLEATLDTDLATTTQVGRIRTALDPWRDGASPQV